MKTILFCLLPSLFFIPLQAQELKSITIKNSIVQLSCDSVIQTAGVRYDSTFKKSCTKYKSSTSCNIDTTVTQSKITKADTIIVIKTYNKPVEMKFIFNALLATVFAVQVNGQTFNASKYGFAWYSDTTTVAAVPINYGMFVLSRSVPPLGMLTQRISRVDSLVPRSPKWYRLNFTYSGPSSITNCINNIQNIHVAGLKVELTYDETLRLSSGGSGLFATDTAAMGRHLDSIFSVAPVDLVVCRNEPSTTDYTTDTAAHYIPEMLCLIYHAHKYGIKVSAYTTTQTGVYALYDYYQSNGLTDSLSWLQDVSGIHSITGPVAQHAIFFFNTIMPAVAASNSDYADVHYYAPFGLDKTDTTWSDLFKVFVAFVRSQSGKDVTVTEFGTDNNSQYLLNRFLNEMFGLNIKYQIYFDGDNSRDAVNLSDYYYDYLN